MHKPTGEQVLALRNEFGLSRKTFGDITNTAERTVRAWEEGSRQMSATYWVVYQVYFRKQEPVFFEGEVK